MKGRDVLIGVAIGAFVVLFLTNYHSGKSPPPHPKPSVSAQSSHRPAAVSSHHRDTRPHHSTAAAVHHKAGPRPSTDAASARSGTGRSGTARSGTGRSGTGGSATGKPTTDALPSAHPITGGRAASPAAKSSGLSNGLIVVASLIAIAAALSTVTLTVRGLRAAK
jgi:hypothetical protein